ncbi:MAG: hypothetical protein ACOCT9_01730 [archaeon]
MANMIDNFIKSGSINLARKWLEKDLFDCRICTLNLYFKLSMLESIRERHDHREAFNKAINLMIDEKNQNNWEVMVYGAGEEDISYQIYIPNVREKTTKLNRFLEDVDGYIREEPVINKNPPSDLQERIEALKQISEKTDLKIENFLQKFDAKDTEEGEQLKEYFEDDPSKYKNKIDDLSKDIISKYIEDLKYDV